MVERLVWVQKAEGSNPFTLNLLPVACFDGPLFLWFPVVNFLRRNTSIECNDLAFHTSLEQQACPMSVILLVE